MTETSSKKPEARFFSMYSTWVTRLNASLIMTATLCRNMRDVVSLNGRKGLVKSISESPYIVSWLALQTMF
jgi:hypothetical protein